MGLGLSKALRNMGSCRSSAENWEARARGCSVFRVEFGTPVESTNFKFQNPQRTQPLLFQIICTETSNSPSQLCTLSLVTAEKNTTFMLNRSHEVVQVLPLGFVSVPSRLIAMTWGSVGGSVARFAVHFSQRLLCRGVPAHLWTMPAPAIDVPIGDLGRHISTGAQKPKPRLRKLTCSNVRSV